MSATVTRKDIGFRSERGPILIALMLSTGLVAIESTILATAVPGIVADLGNFSQFPWLFSIYLLAQSVSVPIYAKLSDTLGRKPIILFGIGLFLVGSILCGFAWSMPALIAFRVVQGLGAGAIQPMSVTISGDIYSIAERAKVQGYIVSVWGMASVIGPTLGGVFVQFISWRWIFFVNIPLCLLAGWMLYRNFHEKIEPRKHRVDYLGSVLLMLSLSLLILATLEGGQAWAWDSPQSIGAFALGALLLVAFVFAERRAAEPVLPLWVLSRRLLLTTSLVALGLGAAVLGLTSYIPTYLVISLGAAPVVAGLTLAFLTIGWPLAAAMAGRIYLRIGFRNTVLIGFAFVIVGSSSLAFFALQPSFLAVAISCFVVGIGMGLTVAPSLIAAQSSVPWNERGVVTGTQIFARNIGGAVGVAVFGAIANSIFIHGAGEKDPATIEHAVQAVFFAVIGLAVLALIAAFAMPKSPVPRDEPALETGDLP